MSNEELLKPRYKVIADMPFNHFTVGQIVDDINTIEGYQFNKYPHLFKKLEWWEERNPEEMPQYVKNKFGRVYNVAEADEKYSNCFMYDCPMTEHWVEYTYCDPATKQEYEQYINSKQPS